MSDSVRPHRRQPTRLPGPWDSPGKNTGVGCHCLLQCRKVKSESEVVQSCPTPSDPMDYSPLRLLRPWDFPGKSTGVGCHCLLHSRLKIESRVKRKISRVSITVFIQKVVDFQRIYSKGDQVIKEINLPCDNGQQQ